MSAKMQGAIAIMLMVIGLLAGPAWAADGPDSTCTALSGDHNDIEDAPSHVLTAKMIVPAPNMPGFCQVQGYIQPNIGFVLRLPAAWNGKFIESGCGGTCGTINIGGCDQGLRKGYACIATDMGHKGGGLDASWAYNNLQAEIDHGFRATHVAALAGKAITARYYNKAPTRSYYTGCSTGGRQGLQEAQRFPFDFDGIIAGAPAGRQASMILAWNATASLDKSGNSVLTPNVLRLVNKQIVDACEMDDGIKDGLIADPRSCAFDVGTLVCKAGKKDGCITQAQADAIKRIHTGPVNSKGEKIHFARPLPGSELNWFGYIAGANAKAYVVPLPGEQGTMTNYYQMMNQQFRYLQFIPDPGPSYDIRAFDWDKDPQRMAMMEMLYARDNPDLRKFKARGGKMISYQGWNDQSVMPEQIIDYYEITTATMGGPEKLKEFYRLFMVPGMNHCAGGIGAHAIDYLTALETWVEKGQAPDLLLGANVTGSVRGDFPLDPAAIRFTRPHYTYPLIAHYKGSGDPNDAANFEPRMPAN